MSQPKENSCALATFAPRVANTRRTARFHPTRKAIKQKMARAGTGCKIKVSFQMGFNLYND